VLEAYQKAIERGINFIDTAEIYGRGKSEKIVGEAIRGHREEVVIASKVSPFNLGHRGVMKAAERSLRRLEIDTIDLYQIHFPNPLFPIQNTMKAMKKLVKQGRIRSVGVSNFNLKKLKDAQEALAPIELVSNQVRFNLLDREIEQGLLPYANTERITIIAYSPLAQGLLTGKYKSDSRPTSFIQGVNPGFSSRNLTRLAEVNRALSESAKAHGKTPSQVALNWLICKDNIVAIPGVKNAEHAISDAGAVDWRLTALEIETLEKTAAEVRFDRISAIPNLVKVLTRL